MVSAAGNVFYLNRISHGLAQDMANPQIRKYMNFYPHFDNKSMSQVWHGHKMLEDAPDHLLTPMVRTSKNLYYVNELVKRKSDWFLPLRWFLQGGNQDLFAFGYRVKQTEFGLHVCSDTRAAVPVSTFCKSYPELKAAGSVPLFDDRSKQFETRIPHPLRKIAGKRPVYSIPLIIFVDDASGNVSKQWNKHHCCYISNGALPREVLQAESNVRFVTTSPHASPLELLGGVKDNIEQNFRDPILAFDCEAREEVLLRPYALFFPADNPMQAGEADGQPLSGSNNCCTCDIGGTEESKRTESGNIRSPLNTLSKGNQLLDLSVQACQTTRIAKLSCESGVKDSLAWPVIQRLQATRAWLQKSRQGAAKRTPQEIKTILRTQLNNARSRGCINPLLTMDGVNIHQDTPTEILHTVLLGVVKYFWGQTTFVIEKNEQLDKLEARLKSLSTSGLAIPALPAHYICTWRGSLNGKHFKALVQTIVFACYDLVDPNLLEVWLLMGRLTVLLWQTHIPHLDIYLGELKGLIDDFLLASARCSPSIIMVKPKFHFLVHLPLFIRRFGPALLFSTERFESFHGVFRAASTHSNHHAPSRDIAEAFVGLDRLKHICSGGYWREGALWVCAGFGVASFVASNKHFASMIGLSSQSSRPPGMFQVLILIECLANNFWPYLKALHDPFLRAEETQLFHQKIGRHLSNSAVVTRSVRRVLHRTSTFRSLHSSHRVATKSRLGIVYYLGKSVNSIKHLTFDMPVLNRDGPVLWVRCKSIIAMINVQHDCLTSGACRFKLAGSETQEREETNRPEYRIVHKNDGHFVLNIQALHNAELIRQALPASIWQRHTFTGDSQAIHRAAVEKLVLAAKQKTAVAKARKSARDVYRSALGHDSDGSSASVRLPRPRKKRRRAVSSSSDDSDA
ncbi:hypothetical protein BDV93DRAFT_576227 [Ceratobasidium sp. AG-I]|nr:hypothetical protein BDV93DRAFT_576227 [Ceratobasidium sp. AG-I]